MLNRNIEFVWSSRSTSHCKVVFMNPLDDGGLVREKFVEGTEGVCFTLKNRDMFVVFLYGTLR